MSQLECPEALSLQESIEDLSLDQNIMVNLVDPIEATSVLLVFSPILRKWVTTNTGLEFKGIAAQSTPILLRKQILRQLLEST